MELAIDRLFSPADCAGERQESDCGSRRRPESTLTPASKIAAAARAVKKSTNPCRKQMKLERNSWKRHFLSRWDLTISAIAALGGEVDQEKCLWELSRYVHLNPIRLKRTFYITELRG